MSQTNPLDHVITAQEFLDLDPFATGYWTYMVGMRDEYFSGRQVAAIEAQEQDDS